MTEETTTTPPIDTGGSHEADAEAVQAKAAEIERLAEHLAAAETAGNAAGARADELQEALTAKTAETEAALARVAELEAAQPFSATPALPSEDRVCDLWMQAGGTAKDFVQAQAFAKLLIEG